MEIMDMKNGTKIMNKRSGLVYTIQDWANDVSRKLHQSSYSCYDDYINRNTQNDYEVIDDKEVLN